MDLSTRTMRRKVKKAVDTILTNLEKAESEQRTNEDAISAIAPVMDFQDTNSAAPVIFQDCFSITRMP